MFDIERELLFLRISSDLMAYFKSEGIAIRLSNLRPYFESTQRDKDESIEEKTEAGDYMVLYYNKEKIEAFATNEFQTAVASKTNLCENCKSTSNRYVKAYLKGTSCQTCASYNVLYNKIFKEFNLQQEEKYASVARKEEIKRTREDEKRKK
jgi:hypothetical protein